MQSKSRPFAFFAFATALTNKPISLSLQLPVLPLLALRFCLWLIQLICAFTWSSTPTYALTPSTGQSTGGKDTHHQLSAAAICPSCSQGSTLSKLQFSARIALFTPYLNTNLTKDSKKLLAAALAEWSLLTFLDLLSACFRNDVFICASSCHLLALWRVPQWPVS